MRDAKSLLEALTKAMPPKPGQFHNITLHEDRLLLGLMLPERRITFYLQEADMDTPVGDLAGEIKNLMDVIAPDLKEGS